MHVLGRENYVVMTDLGQPPTPPARKLEGEDVPGG